MKEGNMMEDYSEQEDGEILFKKHSLMANQIKEEDMLELINKNSILIEGDAKVGKTTFLLYLSKFLFKQKIKIFTPQERYLFDKRIDSASSQFPQFENISEYLNRLFLKQDWFVLKQRYGYEFFVQEIERMIAFDEEKVFVLHRFGEFFEFQDRHQIEKVYKALVKTASEHNKTIIFLINRQSENHEFIKAVADEFSDIYITLKEGSKGERLVVMKNIQEHKEYPVMHFNINHKQLLLEYNNPKSELIANIQRTILVTELDGVSMDIYRLCSYIFNRPNFEVNYADSIQKILKEIFIRPDLIIISMERKDENFETIEAIKKQLPKTPIIAVHNQNFVRSEDKFHAYTYGCDELLQMNYTLENLILSLTKALKYNFYADAKESLNAIPHIIETPQQMKEFISTCIKYRVYFSLFIIQRDATGQRIFSTRRRLDYLYETDTHIYHIALHTLMDVEEKILEHYIYSSRNVHITSVLNPIEYPTLESMEAYL